MGVLCVMSRLYGIHLGVCQVVAYLRRWLMYNGLYSVTARRLGVRKRDSHLGNSILIVYRLSIRVECVHTERFCFGMHIDYRLLWRVCSLTVLRCIYYGG